MTKKDDKLDLEETFEKLLKEYDLTFEEDISTKEMESKIRIQAVEEYFVEIGLGDHVPKKIQKDYPDLFNAKLDIKDDIISESPGVEATPATQLYASLLTIKSMQKRNELIKRHVNKLPKGKKKTKS